MENEQLNISEENGLLSITIGTDILCHAVTAGRPIGYEGVKITDKDAFIKNLIVELNSESEDGSTSLHRLFDNAVSEMIENGEEGLEIDEEE